MEAHPENKQLILIKINDQNTMSPDEERHSLAATVTASSRPWPKKTPKNVPEARPEAGDTRQEFGEVGNSDTVLVELARPSCHGELRRTV